AMLMHTLRALLSLSAPLEKVLPAFTSNVADLLRLRDRGRLVAGNAADCIVLDDDAAVSGVMAGGIWHLRDGKQQVFGTFEPQGPVN
ncbi:MAG: beta-aspartyl-peptidase, partial [Gammaproteobacteria bacterium]|nr:beta-aspartyl-peptidase [Gammaproteobacteria bacterium]